MMIQKFKEHLSILVEDRNLHFASDSSPRILLAVSGGIDSMCMAHLFERSFYKNIAVATVNFKLREDESDADEELVRLWAEERSIEFFSTSFSTKEYAKERGISTQMAARDLRYSWFYSLMEEYSFDYLAIAHNLNDSVETYFLNSLRGTGIQGLCGIRRKSGKIIRPLLSITRDEIACYVKAESIPFRNDMTNFESHYSRNRLRNLVFPEFEEINPSFLRTVERNMQNVESAADILDELFMQKKSLLFDEAGGRIDIAGLSAEKRPEYWLFMLLNDYGFNSLQIEQIKEALVGQPGKEFHSESHMLLRDRKYLLLFPKTGHRKGMSGENSPERTIIQTDLEDKFELIPDHETEKIATIIEDENSDGQNIELDGDALSDFDFMIELDTEPEESVSIQDTKSRGKVAEFSVSLPATGKKRRITIGKRVLELSLYNKPVGFQPKRRRQMIEMSGNLFDTTQQRPVGDIVMMDAATLVHPITIRSWADGDRFIPLGMSGFKKISDYLTDIKIDKVSKEDQLVMTSGDKIAVLIGRRVDERFKITPATSKILEIQLIGSSF